MSGEREAENESLGSWTRVASCCTLVMGAGHYNSNAICMNTYDWHNMRVEDERAKDVGPGATGESGRPSRRSLQRPLECEALFSLACGIFCDISPDICYSDFLNSNSAIDRRFMGDTRAKSSLQNEYSPNSNKRPLLPHFTIQQNWILQKGNVQKFAYHRHSGSWKGKRRSPM